MCLPMPHSESSLILKEGYRRALWSIEFSRKRLVIVCSRARSVERVSSNIERGQFHNRRVSSSGHKKALARVRCLSVAGQEDRA